MIQREMRRYDTNDYRFSRGDYEINVRLGDKLIVICPQLKRMEDDDGAYLIIHKVMIIHIDR